MGGWRQLQKEELRSLYSTLIFYDDQIKDEETEGAYSTYVGAEKYIRVAFMEYLTYNSHDVQVNLFLWMSLDRKFYEM
jgi:spore coat protein CotH